MGEIDLEHVLDGSAERMINKPKIEVAAALYKRGYSCIVSAKGHNPFR
jgi:hypothetical protein